MAGHSSSDRQVDSSPDEAIVGGQESIGPDAGDRALVRGGDHGAYDVRRDLRDRSAQNATTAPSAGSTPPPPAMRSHTRAT